MIIDIELPALDTNHLELLQMTCEVVYDVDTYVQHLEQLLDDNLEVLIKFKQRLNNLRAQLNEEELIRKKV